MAINMRLLSFIFLLGVFSSTQSMQYVFRKPQQSVITQLGNSIKTTIRNNPIALAPCANEIMEEIVPFIGDWYGKKYRGALPVIPPAQRLTLSARATTAAKALLYSVGTLGIRYGSQLVASSFLKGAEKTGFNPLLKFMGNMLIQLVSQPLTERAGLSFSSALTGIEPTTLDQITADNRLFWFLGLTGCGFVLNNFLNS